MGYFHNPVREEGLGVTSLRTTIPAGMTLARIKGPRFSGHPARYVTIHLNQLKWNVLWKPHYNVHRKVMKAGLVATRGAMAVIIDVQVVGTDIELAFLHQQKADRYTLPDMLQQVQGNRQEPPLVTTVTMNFRDIWSKDSARDLLLLGLTKSDLKLMTLRCLQGGPPMLLGTLQNDDCD
ncbi:reverse transcriptase, putative [Ixodes scapularis]|uniref:Reverse transcriptase, putative n=1 Tax=Ixodes scapularis TaxID=6945 RepID=B7QCB2_IXOSC|nr:reverse transcriptase, putative [Ixodes scapularis]|eukprot:XP_002413176.1 reverse transcriptase, putative [Ixodes scapularis]